MVVLGGLEDKERSGDDPGGQGHASHQSREYEEGGSAWKDDKFPPCKCVVWVPLGSWARVQWLLAVWGLRRHRGGQRREVSAEEEVARERGQEERGAGARRPEAPTSGWTKPLQRKMRASGPFPCQPLPGCDLRWHKGEREVGEDSGPEIGGDRPSRRCQTQCPSQGTS